MFWAAFSLPPPCETQLLDAALRAGRKVVWGEEGFAGRKIERRVKHILPACRPPCCPFVVVWQRTSISPKLLVAPS